MAMNEKLEWGLGLFQHSGYELKLMGSQGAGAATVLQGER
jgi:hypothetical protein